MEGRPAADGAQAARCVLGDLLRAGAAGQPMSLFKSKPFRAAGLPSHETRLLRGIYHAGLWPSGAGQHAVQSELTDRCILNESLVASPQWRFPRCPKALSGDTLLLNRRVSA